MLPFVSEREFLTRILWSIAVDQPPTLLRSAISRMAVGIKHL